VFSFATTLQKIEQLKQKDTAGGDVKETTVDDDILVLTALKNNIKNKHMQSLIKDKQQIEEHEKANAFSEEQQNRIMTMLSEKFSNLEHMITEVRSGLQTLQVEVNLMKKGQD
jgi:hypothetical protein